MPDLRTCSHCAQTFEGRLFNVHFGPKRYERCPHCRRWTEIHYVPPKSSEMTEHREIQPSEEDVLKRKIEESKYEVL